MIFRNLDSQNDWTFGSGKQNFSSQNKAIGLNVKTRIQSWVGDCFFDLNAGIDWVNRLGSKNQRQLLEIDLRRIILQSEDVTGINFLTTTLNGRNFSAQYSINTIYSQDYVDQLNLENLNA